MARYRSSRDPEVVYESTADSCTCPGFMHRGICAHTEQQQRWVALNQPVSDEIVLDPPPPMGSWKVEEV